MIGISTERWFFMYLLNYKSLDSKTWSIKRYHQGQKSKSNFFESLGRVMYSSSLLLIYKSFPITQYTIMNSFSIC